MADDKKSAPGMIPGVIPGVMQEFVAQLRGVAERLEGLTGLADSLPSMPSLPSVPVLRSLPAPGALSAAQVKTITTSVAAQRRSIEALTAQLAAFDEQLVVLERILEPLVEWSKTWADIEERLMRIGRGPNTEDKSGGS
jgi:hypothetical protein